MYVYLWENVYFVFSQFMIFLPLLNSYCKRLTLFFIKTETPSLNGSLIKKCVLQFLEPSLE